ncbi:hypothetical protein WOLCODRAFT_94620 [Wolfiporia cocos MD-104 SS10]|uniref:Uncharacterized protein n=1 Tax=Wolfiporia cocos (strain MD-104) TaxID=742152 RepID=A0A2H3JBF4_WOLCO|nr:hypothetical protein WOLCODRAFT_94620 [Wolfiporia cocos MD-104 SS10]
MSTRVQKGGTVFRPVAKPRPRPATETRHTSTAPDTRSSATSSSASQDTSDAPLRTVSEMSPPNVEPKRIASEPSTSQIVHEEGPPTQPQNDGTPSHNEYAFSASTSSYPRISVPTRESSRPPPVQTHLSHNVGMPLQTALTSTGNIIHIPSRELAPPIVVSQSRQIPVVVSSSAPPAHPPPVETLAGPSHNLPPMIVQSSGIIYPMYSAQQLPPPIDPSQIDPALMNPPDVMLPPSFPPELGYPHASASDDGPRVGINGESSVKLPRPRRKSSKKAGGGDEDTDGTATSTRRQHTRGADDTTDALAGVDADANNANKPPRKRRSRKASGDASGGEGDESSSSRKRRRSTNPRRSGSRSSSVVPFDASADPGEELDPTVVTMSALCDDTGQGRVSSRAAQIMTNHATWRAANKEKRARMKAIAEAKKYGRDIENDDETPNRTMEGPIQPDSAAGSSSQAPGDSANLSASSAQINAIDGARAANDEFDYTQSMSTSRYNVQIRIGANGEAILDEESLYVNRNEEQDTENYTHVEESDTSKFVNSLTYSKKTRGSRWSAEETELFFDALQQFGENYELISYILPGRDRKQCKNKFKAEDKKNPARITYCLSNKRPFDIETLSRMTGKDFSGPTPVIRAPTPLLSAQLDTSTSAESTDAAKKARKKSRTPGLRGADDGEEILGVLDDMEKEDSLFGDGN